MKRNKIRVRVVMMLLIAILVAGGCGYEPQAEQSPEKSVTLTVELFDRFNTPTGAPPITDNFLTGYIQEQFGDPNGIEVEFVTVPRSEEVSKLNVLMAANQAPDIIFTYDEPTVHHYVERGELTDLGPLLEQYGPDLTQLLDDVLEYGVIDGIQYTIPAKRVIKAQSTTIIRKDWLDELGLAVPETTEQFYEAMKAFKDNQLTIAGKEIVPYGYLDPFHVRPLQYSFWDWDQIDEEDLYVLPSWMMPGNKEAFRFLNRMYHEQLIDPNFALQMDKDTQQFQKDMVNGRIGAATPNTNEPVYMGYLAELERNDPNAILIPIDPFTDSKGRTRKMVFAGYGMHIMVPKSSKNAAEAVQYLNWMAQPEHYMTLQNGIEGITYVMEDGIPVTLDNDDTRRMLFNYFDYSIILNNKIVAAGDEQMNIQANASDPRYKEFTIQSIRYGMKDGFVEPNVPVMIESEIRYANALDSKYDEIFVKVITAEPEMFDEVYDYEVDQYMQIGGRQVMEEKRNAYRNMLD